MRVGRVYVISLLVALFSAWAGEPAADDSIKLEASIDNEDGDEGDDAEDKDYRMVTGLDFSYWAGESENLYGPGLSFGFVLVPGHLELGLSLGAMTGKTWHMIPVEIVFQVPFQVTRWMDLYVDFGPTILTKKTHDYTQNSWAVSCGGGLELLPVGFDWGVFAEFDYNYRFTKHLVRKGEEDNPHTYGFTAGFNYRF